MATKNLYALNWAFRLWGNEATLCSSTHRKSQTLPHPSDLSPLRLVETSCPPLASLTTGSALHLINIIKLFVDSSDSGGIQ